MSDLKVAVRPQIDLIERAVEAGGGVIAEPEDADAVVWVDPRDPEGLRDLLATSKADWVQLPFAGIESFFAAGVIDPSLTWTCAKGAYGPVTAEQALGLVLLAARRLDIHARAHTWQQDPGARRMDELTVLIVGTGGIGRALAEMLAPLRARVLAVSASGTPMPGAERTVPAEQLGEIFNEADMIVVAAPSTEQTRGMFDAEAFARVKPGAWLINVARGDLVDTRALIDALESGALGGAALDVTDPEPLPDDHPLWSMPNVVITSHTANTPRMALDPLAEMVEHNVRARIAGRPLQGVVDPAKGY